ncbi:T9SS type A sorting domain-containing protein [Dawidia soli]|uniref:T9SS type A sorting domain-containing protein n=1 Tax=Dawidia soli TaxID=2782352 RepID=A0AAP2DI63_9BACT|nr:T9SS type A sorting domain-containing protein [Dawidia soli]MBT1689817.1 T9SS type A sorting domain-containing protein [Dawidia soli]
MKTTLLSFLLVPLFAFQLVAQTPEAATTSAAVDTNIAVTPGPISGNTCIATTGTQTYSVPAILGVRYLWQIVQGAEHTKILSGQNTNRVSVQSLTEGTSVLRVYAYIGLTGGECSDPFREVEIHKIFTIGGTDVLTGPTCMDASMLGEGAVIMYGIKPYLGSYNSGAGYVWTISPGLQELYRSSDGSAIFLKVTNTAADQQVSVKIGSACNGNNNVFTKTLKALAPAPTFESGAFCISDAAGTEATFSVTNNPQGVFGYQWILPDNWSVVSANGPDSTQVTVRFNDSGRGNIIVRSSRAGCGDRFTSFGVNRYPEVAPPIMGPECVAFGNTTPLTYRIQGGANTYTWDVSPASAGWTVLPGNGPSIVIIPAFENIPATGEVEVHATIEGDCGTAPVASVLKVKTGPDKPAAINGLACVPYGTTSSTYNVAPVARATGYQWQIPTTWSVSGATNGTSITVNPNNTNGTLKVTALGCSSASASNETELAVRMGPATPAAISGPVCIAYGATGMLYSIDTIADAIGYQWEVPAGWSYAAGPDQHSITITATDNTAGTIRVKALGCDESANSNYRSLQVSIGPPPPSTINGLRCIATAGNLVTYSVAPVVNAVGYAWSFPFGWTVQGASNATSINVISSSTSGTISVRALGCDATTGSAASEALVVVAPAQPGAIRYYVDGIVNNTCISKDATHTVTFSIDAVAGADSYTWTFPAAWGVDPINTAVLSVTVTTDAASGGTVTVTANHASGCNSTARTQQLIRSGLDFCVDITAPIPLYKVYYIDPGTISNGTASYYRWFAGSSGTPLSEGPDAYAYLARETVTGIRVVITDSNGCETAFSVPDNLPVNTNTCNYTNAADQQTASTMARAAGSDENAFQHGKPTGRLKLFPNPASDVITVTLPENVPQGNMMIYSAAGNQMEARSGVTKDVVVDIGSYSEGVYYIAVSSSLGMFYDKFIVKH